VWTCSSGLALQEKHTHVVKRAKLEMRLAEAFDSRLVGGWWLTGTNPARWLARDLVVVIAYRRGVALVCWQMQCTTRL
jgi:hypothetical protein